MRHMIDHGSRDERQGPVPLGEVLAELMARYEVEQTGEPIDARAFCVPGAWPTEEAAEPLAVS